MFTRFYFGLISSILALVLLNLAIFWWSYENRLDTYIKRSLAGVMALVAEQVARAPDSGKENYLNIASEVLGARIESKTRAETSNNIEWNISYQKANQSEPSNEVVSFIFEQVDEQVFRGHAVLLAANPQPELTYAKTVQSTYRVNYLDSLPQKLDRQQTSRLENGSAVVVYANDKPEFDVFIRARPQGFIKLGPIKEFETLPQHLVIAMMLTTTLILSSLAYVFVARLENRIEKISLMVRSYGRSALQDTDPGSAADPAGGDLDARITITGNDQITRVSEHINNMADRINMLVNGQREIMQAVSHELRTPLARMKFRLSELSDESEPSSHPELAGLEDDIAAIELLADEVLEFHRLAQTEKLDAVELDVFSLCTRVVDNARIIHPNIDLNVVLDSKLQIRGDSRALDRALSNLVDNACKYGATSVALSARSHKDSVQLIVKDNGPGIPTELRVKVFEAFNRGNAQQSKRGYGLGLSIVKRIIDLHRGNIRIEDHEGTGAMIVLTLPA